MQQGTQPSHAHEFPALDKCVCFSLSQRLPQRELGWPNGATLDMLSDEHVFDSSPEKCLVHGLGNAFFFFFFFFAGGRFFSVGLRC